MVQGTGSHVGKSLIVAGLARAYARRGLAVRPFKPQNMSNNAAIIAGGGGEIGRAQALQARASFVAPTAHMNPVLLKPEGETGSQIVVQGRVVGRMRARDYAALKPRLLPRVLESFAILGQDADLILVALWSAQKAFSSGTWNSQGGHQVAQKSMMTVLPRNEESVTGSPASEGRLNSGASSRAGSDASPGEPPSSSEQPRPNSPIAASIAANATAGATAG